MKSLLSLTALLVLPQVLFAAVEGRVVTSAGAPLEQARVEDAHTGVHTYSNALGEFALEPVEKPLTLLVTHPRFHDGVVQLEELPAQPLEIQLEPKQTVYEEIVVSANRASDTFSPVSVASTIVEPAAESAPPSSLSEALVDVAGVSENGQGGLFQVLSVRGVSRQRVLPLIAGMRVVTERRAGAAVSFVDPLLMDAVDVVRGPASTWYGSGALGGVVQVLPQRFSGVSAAAGYETQGDESYVMAGWGEGGWSLGLARRRAEDGEAADGSKLFNGFEQVSAALSKTWIRGRTSYELLAVPAAGRDIHKPNTDYPERTTRYPEENHLLLKASVVSEQRWRLSVYAHPNELATETVEVGASRNEVHNEAFDFGADFQQEVTLGERTEARFGVEYFGRRGVTAEEVDTPLDGSAAPAVQKTLDDGMENELAGYGSVRLRLGGASLQAGGRFTWLEQSNAGEASLDRNAWSGFVGLTVPLGESLELAANAGTGLRFPSLTERFFTGTTGRGQVIGNADLDPERSLSTDVGLRFFGEKVYVAAFAFRNEIDDYIERIRVAPDVRTFVNLTAGTIQGVELEGFVKPAEDWRLSWAAHRMTGRDEDDHPLADIPPDELSLGLRWAEGPWQADGRVALRAAKDDPGSGEVAIPSATVVSASVSRQVAGRWAVTLSGSNLLDEEYLPSADDKAVLAAGRSFGVGLRWNPAGP